jgi:hypothetical protein
VLQLPPLQPPPAAAAAAVEEAAQVATWQLGQLYGRCQMLLALPAGRITPRM